MRANGDCPHEGGENPAIRTLADAGEETGVLLAVSDRVLFEEGAVLDNMQPTDDGLHLVPMRVSTHRL